MLRCEQETGKSNPVATRRGHMASAILHVSAALILTACPAASVLAQETARPGSAAPVAAPPKAADNPAQPKAEPVYRLNGFVLNGTDRVDTDAIIASLPQRKGDLITHSQIKADADHIRAILKAKHIHGEMTTATLEAEGPGNKILVVWEVHLMDALTYAPGNGPRHFGSQSFTGNVKLSDAQLVAATGLKPGQDMPDGSVGDARTGIEQAYDAALPGRTVSVSGKIQLKKDRSVVINWKIVEPK
jgi:hypothetical protein